MKKIVIHNGYAGFSLSKEARIELKKLGEEVDEYGGRTGADEHSYIYEISRDDPRLVAIVEKLGGISARENGDANHCLKIVQIPDDVDWEIKNYDGNEWVAEKHRTWR